MAKRSVFLRGSEEKTFQEKIFDIDYNYYNMEACLLNQKVECGKLGLDNTLEVSSACPFLLGKKLSAKQLKFGFSTVERVYQSSKRMKDGSVPTKLKGTSPDHYMFEGMRYECPRWEFYSWIYMKSLYNHVDWLSQNLKSFDGFTDIYYNSMKVGGCQARALVQLLTLHGGEWKLGIIVEDWEYWMELCSNEDV